MIRRVLNIPEGSRASPWQYVGKDSGEDGAQIDLVFDREDKAFTICEIKFTEEPYVISKAYVKNLINKEKAFVSKTKTKKQIFLTIISANGLKDNIHSGGLVSGVVMAEDFFNSKYISVMGIYKLLF
ncbi:MAG TPA: ATPase [Gammaproteobacteria bacterium]|nr:ATPase [Gammaproteobacteria bacterium]